MLVRGKVCAFPPDEWQPPGGWIENVCITCDLMSTWCCHMKAFFSCSVESVACQFRSCFFCVVAWSSVKSNQLTAVHSDDNKSRRYHFNWGPSLNWGGEGGREGNIFVRWKNNLWSFYVPLRTLENNNTPQQRQQQQLKAPSVINLMGFAYFFLPHKDQAGEITQEGKKWFLKNPQKPQSSH